LPLLGLRFDLKSGKEGRRGKMTVPVELYVSLGGTFLAILCGVAGRNAREASCLALGIACNVAAIPVVLTTACFFIVGILKIISP